MASNIPTHRAALVDQDGLISPEWYRFLAASDQAVPSSVTGRPQNTKGTKQDIQATADGQVLQLDLLTLTFRYPRSPRFTVASLPSASAQGAGTRLFVTDANATTFASVVAGGGTNGVPVYSDGTNWRIG